LLERDSKIGNGCGDSQRSEEAKRTANKGGIKKGKAIPLPGIIRAKNLEVIIIKIIAIKTGPKETPWWSIKMKAIKCFKDFFQQWRQALPRLFLKLVWYQNQLKPR